MFDCLAWRRVVYRVQDRRELVRAELPEHLLLLFHILPILTQRVLLLHLLLGE